MAATGPPTTAPGLPLTYQEYYTQLPDVLQGNYDPLYTIQHAATGQTSSTIYETVVDSTEPIPKVFLALILTTGGDYNVIALHNPWRFRPSTVAAAPQWDGKSFAFLGDIHPTSRFIRTVSFPDDIFDLVTEQRVHQANYITASFAAGSPTMHVLNAVPDGTADTDLVVTGAIIPVPHGYVSLVLSRLSLQPHAAWNTLATAIIADNNTAMCAPLLDWLRVAATKHFDTDGTTILAPANHLGLLETAFPPVLDDQQIAERR